MTKIYLNFYELSENTQSELKQKLFNFWLIEWKHQFGEDPDKIKQEFQLEQINKLFNLDNAGIEINTYKIIK